MPRLERGTPDGLRIAELFCFLDFSVRDSIIPNNELIRPLTCAWLTSVRACEEVRGGDGRWGKSGRRHLLPLCSLVLFNSTCCARTMSLKAAWLVVARKKAVRSRTAFALDKTPSNVLLSMSRKSGCAPTPMLRLRQKARSENYRSIGVGVAKRILI